MRTTSRKGVTLIEIMVVIAIIGVLTTLSIASYQQIGTASAPRNAVNDLTAQLIRARTRAAESQADVWFIIYPTFHKRTLTNPAANAATGGPGAYFLFEDRAMTFNTNAGLSTEVYYRPAAAGVDFDPVADTLVGSTSVEGRFIDAIYLDEYAGQNVSIALPVGGVTMVAKDAPFAGMPVATACTFCSGTPLRGAVVFSPDGSARFIDGDGNSVGASGGTAVSRAHGIAVKNFKDTRVYVVGVSAPTAYIAAYDKR